MIETNLSLWVKFSMSINCYFVQELAFFMAQDINKK